MLNRRRIFMDLINVKVKHRTLGDGVVVAVSGNIVEVEFSVGIKKLKFPDTFEYGMTAVDADIQKKIVDKAKKDKEAAAEAKRAELLEKEEERLKDIKSLSGGKKVKSIDEMFGSDYHVEKLARYPILTYQQVESKFNIRISGFGRGINPTDDTVVLISSIGKAGDEFLYHDKWTEDGDYIYSGEGKNGDQSLTRGNLAIKNAKSDGKEIHLFVKFSPQEYYYQGVFELVDYTYEDDKDEDGNTRKEYKFRLRKI